MFSEDLTVRYSEVGAEGHVDIAQIMTWFQDVATDHSESIGYGCSVLNDNGIAWVVLNWEVCVYTFPRFAQKLTVETWAEGFNVAYGHRKFALKDTSGETLATGDSLWILYDLTKNKFCKVPEEMAQRYGTLAKMPAEALRKWKLPLLEAFDAESTLTVQRRDLDTNGHTNNINYVRFLMDSVPSAGDMRKIRVCYKKSLFLGEQATLRIGEGRAALWRGDELCTQFEFEKGL